jgi:hypothetical protein
MPQWDNVKDFIYADLPCFSKTQYALRKTKGAGGGKFIVGPRLSIIEEIMRVPNRKEYMVTECAPDHKIIVQGNYTGQLAEVTFKKKPMGVLSRSADPKDWKWERLSRLQLWHAVGREFYEFLNEIVEKFGEDAYPVVEFSLYGAPVGILQVPWIIWEVRHY